MTAGSRPIHDGVAATLAQAPVIGAVRTNSRRSAERQAQALLESGLQLVEITFTVPEATEVVADLVANRGTSGPPWFGMGTVSTGDRARAALAAGSEFVVSPNVDPEVASVAQESDVFLILGALTPTEIVEADRLGADLVKVYPLPPVGGPKYLSTVRQPLPDIQMLAAGGFDVDEISAYREAGAVAFTLGAQLLGPDGDADRQRVDMAMARAKG